MNRRLYLLSFLCSITAATGAQAATIVSVSTGSTTVALGAAVASTGWTQTSSYNNVTVSAVLSNLSGIGAGLAMHAFLTDSVGPGTTVANQIASTAFNLAPGNNQNVSLFTGLTLAADSYFLVIQLDGGNSAQGGWAAAVPTVITDAGVSRSADQFSSSAAGYAPASTFSLINQSQQLLYSVQSVDSSVPEPSTAALVLAGLGFAIARRRRS